MFAAVLTRVARADPTRSPRHDHVRLRQVYDACGFCMLLYGACGRGWAGLCEQCTHRVNGPGRTHGTDAARANLVPSVSTGYCRVLSAACILDTGIQASVAKIEEVSLKNLFKSPCQT